MSFLQVDATKMLATSKKKRVTVEGQQALTLRAGITLRHDPATGDHVLRLHDTDIVRILSSKDGEPQRYRIFTGGWRTNTTRDRINEYTGSRIHAESGYWYVGSGHVFREGMTLDGFGDPEPAFQTTPDEALAFRERARVLDKAIAGYCKGFVRSAVDARQLDFPNGGDCWSCSMRPVDRRSVRGDEPMGVSHLIEHFVEKYYVPSLLFNALLERFNWESWQMDTAKLPEKERQAKQEARAVNDYRHMAGDVKHGREPFIMYKVLRNYFLRRKHDLIEVFDPVDFKRRVKEAHKAEED